MAPVPVAVLEVVMGGTVTQAISLAARLRIARPAGRRSLTAEQIAERVEASPHGVRRLPRALVGQALFAARPDGRYEPTPLAIGCARTRPGVASTGDLLGRAGFRLTAVVPTTSPAVDRRGRCLCEPSVRCGICVVDYSRQLVPATPLCHLEQPGGRAPQRDVAARAANEEAAREHPSRPEETPGLEQSDG
jgi:hypothetical protein